MRLLTAQTRRAPRIFPLLAGTGLLLLALASARPASGQSAKPEQATQSIQAAPPAKPQQAEGPVIYTPDPNGPAFDVATIRVANRDDGRRWTGIRTDTAGQYTTSAVSLDWLTQLAYLDPNDNETVVVDHNAPKWINSDSFDIHAKMDGAYWESHSKLTPAQQADYEQKILRRLLAERFHLKLRFEMRPTSVYVLVQAKGGAHVKQVSAPAAVVGDEMEAQAKWTAANPAKPYPGSFMCMDDKCTANAVKIGNAIGQIGSNAKLDKMIIDQTGLTGYYDFIIPYPAKDDEHPTSTVEEALGMRFEKRTIPIKTYIIESAEKPGLD